MIIPGDNVIGILPCHQHIHTHTKKTPHFVPDLMSSYLMLLGVITKLIFCQKVQY